MRVKLSQIAKELGKSIVDISRETGLNRNTVEKLFHNKVEGIRFDTLEALRKTYNLKLEDILEFDETGQKEQKEQLFQQEGSAVPFFGWPAFTSTNKLPKEYFGYIFERGYVYIKNAYGYYYWNKVNGDKIAKLAYERYREPKKLEELYSIFLNYSGNLERMYFELKPEMLAKMENEDLKGYFDEVWLAYEKFWQHSVFVDSIDMGFDVRKIGEIARNHKFTEPEIEILTTPTQLITNDERRLELAKIARKLSRRDLSKVNLETYLQDFVKNNIDIQSYRKSYDIYKSNYAVAEHITDQEIIDELSQWLKDKKKFKTDFEQLKDFSKKQKKKIATVLKKHKLRTNPLYFFNKLIYWREYRKKINQMGFHILNAILAAIEGKTGIAKEYLKYLSYEEIDPVLKGLIGRDVLKNRHDKPFLVIFDEGKYQILLGDEADSLRDELEDKLKFRIRNKSIIQGQTASQGYAKGIARIILNSLDFDKLKSKEILVAGQTQPEFIPIMQKAAAIVTNEAGVTTHAALTSRTLGKPCIIGTKVATKLIKDGDLIEVRANHGTVRILKSYD